MNHLAAATALALIAEGCSSAPVVMESLTLEKAEVAPNVVTLSWTIKEPKPNGNEKVHIARIDSLVVERVKLGENRTTSYRVQNVSKTSCADQRVERKTRYKYRLIPVTDNEKYREKNSNGWGTATRWLEVSTLDIWDLTFSNPCPSPPDKPDDKGFVLIRESAIPAQLP